MLVSGQVFVKLDAATTEAVTHWRVFKVKRLQFGINVTPGVFQKLMENLLKHMLTN